MKKSNYFIITNNNLINSVKICTHNNINTASSSGVYYNINVIYFS